MSPPPSIHSNPFATCWTRPGALPFLETARASVHECLALLRRNRWRGQIVGPHGVGKSTLLRALVSAAEEVGMQASVFGADKASMTTELLHDSCSVVFLDGFEQLSLWRRVAWRRRASGLIVTTHKPAGLPTLATLLPTVGDAEQLFNRLVSGAATRVERRDLLAAFARHRGNLREVWFDLYALHERLTRAANLSA